MKLILFIIHLPKLFIRSIFKLRYIGRLKEYAKTPFICPICGKRFYTKWYKLWSGGEMSLELSNKAVLKCPSCGTKDRCKWDLD